jgi:hypothetical protein
MKANAHLNISLFGRFDQSTRSIGGGTMICHSVKSAGTYRGTVFQDDKETGSFIVECTDTATSNQVDIDLYTLNNRIKSDCDCNEEKIFLLKPEGFAVFYSSFGEGAYKVLLGSQADNSTYSTERLMIKDVVVFLLMRPGNYKAKGPDRQECDLIVEGLPSAEEYSKVLSLPVNITMDSSGFSNREIRIFPGQGLVINMEAEGAVEIKMIKANDPEEIPRDRRPHKWENPKYKSS